MDALFLFFQVKNNCIFRRKVKKEIVCRKWAIFLLHPDRMERGSGGSKISVRVGLSVGNIPTLIFLRSQTQTHSKRIHFRMRFFIRGNPK
jgi:hypothetical protein